MRSARAPAIRELAHRRRSRVLAGIDTHKDTLAVAVIDDAGRPVVVTELANTETGFTALEQLLVAHAVRRVGIEGSGNYGRGAAVHLVLTGPAEVVEVPPGLTSRERSGRPGGGRTDPVDAVAIARITAREPGLPAVRLAVGQAADLRALADYRAQLVAERTPNCTACCPATRPGSRRLAVRAARGGVIHSVGRHTHGRQSPSSPQDVQLLPHSTTAAQP
jgi:transposase